MFSKPTRNPSAQDVAQPRRPVVASLIAEGVIIRGDIASQGDLHLDGVVEGDVAVTQLTIGERGGVTGAVRAETVEIRGHVTGTITAKQVRLCASARVDGDISHAEISIEAGAHFAGRSLVVAPPVSAVEPLSVAAE
jgi:cytoskeletal protein CcmA (bactofilin family)